MISARRGPWWLLGGMWLLLIGCGEVFSDYELKTVTRAEPVFQPIAVFEGSKSWIEVHVRLEGGTASVVPYKAAQKAKQLLKVSGSEKQ